MPPPLVVERLEIFEQRVTRSLIAHPTAKREQRLIDRLVRHTHLQIAGIVEDQPCGDLLRGPSLSQPPLRARQPMRPVILGETSCEW